DICSATRHVRFTPNSDRENGLQQTVMSALPPKADMCGATRDVRFGPIADSCIAAKKSGRAAPMISFVYLSAKCLFHELYGINCRPKFDTKLLDRFFHRRWQVSPPANNLRHRFLVPSISSIAMSR